MATAPKVVYSHITKQPGVRGGKACIDDTRIAVVDVVTLLKQGLTDSQIIEQYPSLNLAQVHAAISYYYDNRGARQTLRKTTTPRPSTSAERLSM